MIGFVLKILFLCSVSGSAQKIDEPFEQMAAKLTKNFKAPLITSQNLKAGLNKKNIVVLDAREKNEFETSHIFSAVNVGYKKFNLKETLKKIPKNKKVVVYCSVGYRSGRVADLLSKSGVEAYNLKGGVFGWVNAGENVVNKDGEQTSKVHGYNKSWSKWIKIGKPVL